MGPAPTAHSSDWDCQLITGPFQHQAAHSAYNVLPDGAAPQSCAVGLPWHSIVRCLVCCDQHHPMRAGRENASRFCHKYLYASSGEVKPPHASCASRCTASARAPWSSGGPRPSPALRPAGAATSGAMPSVCATTSPSAARPGSQGGCVATRCYCKGEGCWDAVNRVTR
jgi:hypothetical protein